MRVVFIRSNPVDPYPRLEKAANYLIRAGHSVHVLAWDRSEKYKSKEGILELKNGSCAITRFGIPGTFGGGFKHNIFSLLKFQKEIVLWLLKNSKSYDLIHAYDFDTGFTASKIASFLKKKVVYDIADYYIDSHNLSSSHIGKIIQKAENKIINKVDAVIICTEKRKQQISPSKPKKLVVIHNSPITFDPQKEIKNKFIKSDSSKLKIVYVGILSNNRFIKEIADIVIEREDCEFHVGGFGELESYFHNLSISYKNIYYYGKIPYAKTLQLESESDVIPAIYNPRVPNHFYAAPNKFYEALMLGKPLIMAKNTGMDDYIEKYCIGEIIEYTAEDFNRAINKLLLNRNKLSESSKRAKNLYYTKFSAEIMESKLVDLYTDLERY